MKYVYVCECMDHTGCEKTVRTMALHEDDAKFQMRQKGLFVTKVRAVGPVPTAPTTPKGEPKVTGLRRLINCVPIFQIGSFALARISPPGRFLNLWEIDYETSTGFKGVWAFCTRKKEPTLSSPTSDAVVIVATVREPDGVKLVLTAEYRLPVGGLEYGFPAGLIDKGESPADTAKRELKEETGLDVVRITQVSPPIVSSAGMSDEAVTLVFVEATGTISTDGQEGTECIQPYLADMKEVADLCYRRGKYEGVTIAAKAWPVLYGYLAALGNTE